MTSISVSSRAALAALAVLASATAATAADSVPDSFTAAAESTINGVVSIKNYATPRGYRQGGAQNFFNDPFFEFFFGPQTTPQRRQQGGRQGESDEQNQVQQGLGSGVILSSDGYIVTNNHVIDGADRLEITLNDNRTFNATVLGTDAVTDLALVKIEAEGLPVIPMGDSDALRVGEWVLAVGNPFGFTSTVTSGIVSAKSRSIAEAAGGQRAGRMGIESYIQTDAAVNPGNSGGALVNLRGELVGINTAIYSQTGSYTGYSFAVPTSIIKKVVKDIKEFGTVQRAVLGVSIRDLDAALIKDKDIKGVTEGVYVASVADLSSALEAGIQEGDVIVSVNDVAVRKSSQLQEQVARYRPGDRVKIGWVRDGKRHDATVTLLNSQGNTTIARRGTFDALGCAFRTVGDELARELKIRGGVQVTGIKKGQMADAGVKDGFVILEINNVPVRSVDDVEKIHDEIMKADGADRVMFVTGIYPTGQRRYYAVDLGTPGEEGGK